MTNIFIVKYTKSLVYDNDSMHVRGRLAGLCLPHSRWECGSTVIKWYLRSRLVSTTVRDSHHWFILQREKHTGQTIETRHKTIVEYLKCFSSPARRQLGRKTLEFYICFTFCSFHHNTGINMLQNGSINGLIILCMTVFVLPIMLLNINISFRKQRKCIITCKDKCKTCLFL